mmetsp:Transcript_38394/g.81909  ORF Transcript_38394/g.81909 Transcript_38394/m.81909 type:complete len:110 (+) Transcript_38394:99-428(+)
MDSPVAQSNPHMSSPQGPDVVQRISTVAAHGVKGSVRCCIKKSKEHMIESSTSHFVAFTTQRSQCTLPQHHVLQNSLCVPLNVLIINHVTPNKALNRLTSLSFKTFSPC